MTLLNVVALKRAVCVDVFLIIGKRASPTHEIIIVGMSERVRCNDLKLV